MNSYYRCPQVFSKPTANILNQLDQQSDPGCKEMELKSHFCFMLLLFLWWADTPTFIPVKLRRQVLLTHSSLPLSQWQRQYCYFNPFPFPHFNNRINKISDISISTAKIRKKKTKHHSSHIWKVLFYKAVMNWIWNLRFRKISDIRTTNLLTPKILCKTDIIVTAVSTLSDISNFRKWSFCSTARKTKRQEITQSESQALKYY